MKNLVDHTQCRSYLDVYSYGTWPYRTKPSKCSRVGVMQYESRLTAATITADPVIQ